MKWLIENIFGTECEFKKFLGNDYIEIDKNVSWLDLPSESFIFYGSLETHNEIVKMDHPYFVRFFYKEKYKCNNYYPSNYKLLLNKDCTLMPFGLLQYNKKHIFDMFMGSWVFIRPNSGCKEFTGTIIGKKHFEKELTYEIFKNVKDEELVLISSYKEIPDEYRMVIIDNELVTSTASLEIEEKFKESILPNIKFNEAIYTVDYCSTYNKIVEINSFSCAGLYNSDYKKIIDKINYIFRD